MKCKEGREGVCLAVMPGHKGVTDRRDGVKYNVRELESGVYFDRSCQNGAFNI